MKACSRPFDGEQYLRARRMDAENAFQYVPSPLKEILVSHAVQYHESQLVTMRLRECLSHLQQKLADTEGALDALHQKHRQQEQGQQRGTSTGRTRSTPDCTYAHDCTHAHDHAHEHARERAHTRGRGAQELNTATRARRRAGPAFTGTGASILHPGCQVVNSSAHHRRMSWHRPVPWHEVSYHRGIGCTMHHRRHTASKPHPPLHCDHAHVPRVWRTTPPQTRAHA